MLKCGRVGGRRHARALGHARCLDLFNSLRRVRWARANKLWLCEKAFKTGLYKKEGTNLEVLKCLWLEETDPDVRGTQGRVLSGLKKATSRCC
jgi:hypothetical protein